MAVVLYDLAIALYGLALRVAVLFSPKAALWVRGRVGLQEKIKSALKPGERRIWMHCASLGEFEQGRPVLEDLRRQYPEYKLVLTFFSPSGYEVRKDYSGADYVFYLPMDGAGAAKRFLDAVAPKLTIFVKYEFWYHYLHEAGQRKIPALLIAAAFRREQPFFKWYGAFFRRILGFFDELLVQDDDSKVLLARIGLKVNVSIGGDTRYDRVSAIAAAAKDLPEIEAFKGTSKVLIGGSTWPEDERILHTLLPLLPGDWKMMLAPHEIDTAHLDAIRRLFGNEAVFYSEWIAAPATAARVLVIDNIGMLSSLYRYGDVAFIGGGFNKGGIHNVLEPAVFGLPVLMGPVYQKFVEAVALVNAGFVYPVKSADEAAEQFKNLLPAERRESVKAGLHHFIQEHTGATGRIMKLIEQKGLL